jgi:flagellar hook protein FlgE
MSLTGAIFIGQSGMDAYTQGLQTISNNVSNLNTTGYKALSTPFIDVFNEAGGSSGFDEAGGQDTGEGVQFGQSQLDFSQGTLEQTNGSLDLAIQGGGFLVLLDGSQTLYARTGSFAVAPNGVITEQGTQFELGVLNSAGQVTPLNVTNLQTDPAVTTTKVTFANNLSSSATTDTVSNIQVFDSTGAAHTWTVALTADASTPGEWDVSVTDETGATVGSGTISFNGSTISSSADTITINTTPSGAEPLSVVLDFSNVTSFSSGTSSTLEASQVDGNAAGTLTTVTVNSSGQVELSYSNNQTKTEGSVALASFLSPQDLTQASNGTFLNTKNSPVVISTSGVNGFGTVEAQELEASNVNLTQEFSELILIQRGFQASSQVVSIANDMIQQLFGIRGQA